MTLHVGTPRRVVEASHPSKRKRPGGADTRPGPYGGPMKSHPNTKTLHSAGGLVAEFVLVTPEIAELWLAQSEFRNRSINEKNVAAQTRDMANGRWEDTGETVKFDHRGNLVDGQHRLKAIIRSGISAELLVVRSLSDAAVAVIDAGQKRTPAHRLEMQGVSYATTVAGATKIIAAIDAGRPGAMATSWMTPAEGLAATAALPGIEDAAGYARRCRRGAVVSVLTPAEATAALYLGRRDLDPAFADGWIEEVVSATNLRPDSGAYLLYVRFSRAKMQGVLIQAVTRMAFTLKAMKKDYAGSRIGVLKWLESESFPWAAKK